VELTFYYEMKKDAFALIEMLIVITILAILAGVSISHSMRSQEPEFDREAFTNMNAISDAQRIFAVESRGQFYPPFAAADPAIDNNINTINTALRLLIPARNWTYEVRSYNNMNPRQHCVAARRTADNARRWRMRSTETAPVANQWCP